MRHGTIGNQRHLFAVAAFSLLALAAASRGADDDVLFLAFFRDNGQAGIFLAASRDGVRFDAVNNDRPVMKPAGWPGQSLTRDPSIVYHDGKFHAVWTGPSR